ncbi:MAG: response regulator transcription factor [Acidobacteria bacterium]|nr:response regulator transcription factor [Acidobacteriota bacterium]
MAADESGSRSLASILRKDKYDVFTTTKADKALAYAVKHHLNLAILDLSVERLDGLDLCEKLRLSSTAPIMVLADGAEAGAKVEAFNRGADQYLARPFGADEFWSAVRALLRRSLAFGPAPAAISIGDLKIDMAQRKASLGGRPIRLTRKEFDLLACLAQNQDRVVPSKMILKRIWGLDYSDTQTLRVHVANLRKKIEEDPSAPRYILTHLGVGFRLATPQGRRLRAAAAAG